MDVNGLLLVYACKFSLAESTADASSESIECTGVIVRVNARIERNQKQKIFNLNLLDICMDALKAYSRT